MRCADCQEFVPPAKQYEPNSIGACCVMNRWLDKFPGRRPKPQDYDRNYALLGGKLFMPLIERDCKRFRGIE
jgi:hypothetical protein